MGEKPVLRGSIEGPGDPKRRSELPSPEDLRMKILVKAKKIHLTATGSIDVEVEEKLN